MKWSLEHRVDSFVCAIKDAICFGDDLMSFVKLAIYLDWPVSIN